MIQMFGDAKRVYKVGELIVGHHGAHGLQPETLAYIDRVTADGGVVIDPVSVNNAYLLIVNNNQHVACAVAADWGVKKDGGQAVEKLYSLSGSDSDLVQATPSARPLWIASGQNGKPTIVFNGALHFIGAAFTLPAPSTYFMVIKQITWVGNRRIFASQSPNTTLYQTPASPQATLYSLGTACLAPATLALNAFMQLTCLFKANASLVRMDGTLLTSPSLAFTPAAPGGFYLAAESSGTNFGNIEFGEAIILSAEPPSYDKGEAYLKAKWGTP